MPANGVVMPYKCSTAINPDGSVCTFACFDNYALDGEVTAECLSSGQWTNPEPVCRSKFFKVFFQLASLNSSYCFTKKSCSYKPCGICAGYIIAWKSTCCAWTLK